MIKKILVYSSILILFTFIFNSLKFEENENSTNDQIEKINFESNDKLITNIATWSSSNDSLYNEIIKVEESSYLQSKKFKEKIIPPSWTYLYKKITKHDNNKLGYIFTMLDSINTKNKLSRYDFADVIVTFVQDIPYNLLVQGSCKNAVKNEAVKKMIDNGIVCDEYVYAGIYTPTEFMANYKGDCDSRTIFLYTILSKYGFDVVILNSDLYSHSIIGVNLPASGNYKLHKGKKYFTWETTNKGWKLGNLPPSYIDLKYWNVVLSKNI